jgi:ribosomal protein L11 methyltransferase
LRSRVRPKAAARPWLELAVEADPEAVEAVSEILSRVAPGGVAVEPAFELVEEGLGARLDPTRPAIVRAYIPASIPAQDDPAVRQVDEALGHLRAFGLRPIGELRIRTIDEADWADAWKAHFPVLRVGRRLVVRPTWRRHRAAPDEAVIVLDPGMAFGTGLHPTTRLCLLGLEALADRGELEGARVLDVGSGSGILSIAAARLGAANVMALDIDPIAVEATAANARRNRLARRVGAREGSLPTGERPFDTVVANLIASLLVRLAADVAAEVRPGGTWLVSGVFREREAEVVASFAEHDLEPTDRWLEGDWVALAGRRRAPPATDDPGGPTSTRPYNRPR